MKRVLLIILFFMFGVSLYAQQEKQAKLILQEMRNKMESLKAVHAGFVFSMQNSEMGIDEKNSGSIDLKGRKYVVSIPDIGVKILSDGKNIWNYMQEGNQVTVSEVDDSDDQFIDPASIFSIYERGFRPEYIGEYSFGSGVCQQIKLYPEKSGFDVDSVLLNIGKTDHLLKSAHLFSSDGNLYLLDIVKLNEADDLPDNYFIFNPKDYTDVEVIDFR